MKKVLIIGMTNIVGGVETFIYNTVVNSDKSKIKYDFLVHGYQQCVYQKEIEEFYDGDVSFYFMPQYKKNPIKCIRSLYQFYKIYGKCYDIIHLQTGAASEIFYIYPFLREKKTMIVVHSHAGSGYHPLENAIAQKFLNHIVDKRIACSKVAANWLFGKKNGKKAEIIINGIDSKKFQYSEKSRKRIRKEYDIPQDCFVIGHVGRFSIEKNHLFIIGIFSQILCEEKSAKLILVGYGEQEEKIKKICQEKEIFSSVYFVGKQDETYAFYSAFDVFLMPSLYEGMPLVGIEAQTSGLPCLFSDEIDMQVLLTDQANMYPLSMESTEWAKAILKYRHIKINRGLYADIIHQKGYSIKNTVEKLEKMYEV